MQLQIGSLSKEADERGPGIAELAGTVQARQQKMASMEDHINTVKDSMYASISKQVTPLSSLCLPSCASIVLSACLSFQLYCSPACVSTILPACPCLIHVACLPVP